MVTRDGAYSWNHHVFASHVDLFIGDGWLMTRPADPCPDCGYIHAILFTDAIECIRCGAVWTWRDRWPE